MTRMRVLWSGILLVFLGTAHDWYWHASQGGTHEGTFFPLPHALMVLGLVVALAGAVRSYRRSTGRQRVALGVAVVGGGIGLIGQLWDETLHYRGIHDGTQIVAVHLIADLGFLAMFVAAGVATWLTRRQPNDPIK